MTHSHNIDNLLRKSESGFNTLGIDNAYCKAALTFLEQWLSDEQFSDYTEQIVFMIEHEDWDYLLDCFYQIIPFGTGGRRGEVGIGPNRINTWTIKSSAQGHSQYLLHHYGDQAKERGVVFTYDVREFITNSHFNDSIANPVRNLNGKRLSEEAATVYAANGIKVFLFDNIRTTPELSFSIRHLNAVAGDMFSASHNPPDHNGKKVYDESGGQLIPPFDEELVDEVTKNVKEIQDMNFKEAVSNGLILYLGEEIDKAYIEAASEVSLSSARDLKIVYTPLHGCGHTSVYQALVKLGFSVHEDPQTSNPSGKFEHVTFNIPNPEVVQSFDTSLLFAKEINADIILNSDPDADRIGVMVNHHGEWKFMNGNEIAGILTEYVISKRKSTGKKGVVVKTAVTTNIIQEMCQKHNITLIGDLLVGFKYIGEIMNNMEKEGDMDSFLFGCEESHGYIAGNYSRDKDAVTAAIWLAELAAELKQEGKTLFDYLQGLYVNYSYFRNYLTEIRLLGATGVDKIKRIQSTIRTNHPKSFGEYTITSIDDYLDRKPIVSETDKSSKDVIAFTIQPFRDISHAKVTIRPSGTEPKIKMYFELAQKPDKESLEKTQESVEIELKKLEKAFMKMCYKIIDIDFPDRGFLLFWQLPLDLKMKYFTIEDSIAKLIDLPKEDRQAKLSEILVFLGSDPVEKVNDAFKAKYGKDIPSFLDLNAS